MPSTVELFLIAVCVIFTLPWLVWRLGRTDYWAPLVVVQIVTGILLGPGVMGAMFPDVYAAVLTSDVIMALNGIAWWAVMLFVFIAGVELDLASAWRNRRDTLVTSALALAVPFIFGCIAAALILSTSGGWVGPRGSSVQAIAGIGMACAVTALPILILFMQRLQILATPLGQRVLRYASLDDIAIWGVLALILFDWTRLGRQAIFVVLFVAVGYATRCIMRRLSVADRWPVALIWLALVGLAADWAGLHFMVGAFLAGVVMDADWFGHDDVEQFRRIILLTVMPIFFLSTGLRTSWDAGGLIVFGAAALLLAAAVGGKLAGVALAGRLLRWPRNHVWVVGWLLQTKALIMIIFANVLLDRGVIASSTFTALLLMAVGSTMLTIPAVQRRVGALREGGAGDTAP